MKNKDRIFASLIALCLFLFALCYGSVLIDRQELTVMRYSEPGGSAEWMIKFLGPPREELTIKEWIKAKRYQEIPIPAGTSKVLWMQSPLSSYCYVFVDDAGIIKGRFWFDT